MEYILIKKDWINLEAIMINMDSTIKLNQILNIKTNYKIKKILFSSSKINKNNIY